MITHILIFLGSDQTDIETDDDHNQDCEIPTYVQRTVAVTHDNASNITKALHNSSLQSIRCFAHTLNLSVQKFSKAINEHISHMREVVKYIHKSPAATKLVEVCSANCHSSDNLANAD